MRFRALHLLLPALLLLGFAWSLSGIRSPLPAGDEATDLMMAQSLWHDHDLVYAPVDLDRAERLWEGGPAGLELSPDLPGKAQRYGRPVAWPLAALPFYAVLGERGLVLLNMLLFLAMAGAALWHLREETGLVHLFVGGFFFASAAVVHALRMESQVFAMACLFFPLLMWLRARERDAAPMVWAGAGVLLGLLLLQSPWSALVGLAIVADLAGRRRWRSLLSLVLPAVVIFALLAALQGHAFGSPLEPSPGTGLRLLPRNLVYLLAGRFTGLLPYFPFALFALALYLAGPRDRARNLLAAALGVYALAVLIAHPHDFAGSPGFVGSRYLAAVYPAFVLLPLRLSARRSLAIPFLAAGLWTAVALAGSLPRLVPEGFQVQTAASFFRRLPLELTLLPGRQLPGYAAQTWGDAIWFVPSRSFFVEERHPHGVWVRGASRSEVVVVSPKPLSRLNFLAYSLSPDNELRLASGADRVLVRFDSEGKRQGTPIELRLHPAARDLGFFPGASTERFYRFTLEATGGLVPARHDPKSHDPRFLGVFLDFTGEGP
jgi:hypothetical protein